VALTELHLNIFKQKTDGLNRNNISVFTVSLNKYTFEQCFYMIWIVSWHVGK